MGVKVQQYFLDLEVALYKYKNYIIEGMNNKIQQLENNQKPKINATKKIIYMACDLIREILKVLMSVFYKSYQYIFDILLYQ